jgi:hypothetical protein
MKPLRECARLLRKTAPAYMTCPCNVYPTWTHARATAWGRTAEAKRYHARRVAEYRANPPIIRQLPAWRKAA